ncbi:YcaO-like family protein [Photobacterium leiognathi]|uniref:YcaO-like family protein n=1 Tax=Photobacterium leiognathi TaxID=553611 RepID=UPI002982311C|nr:YcaO-like family protein [Photobacterium leiognathi]
MYEREFKYESAKQNGLNYLQDIGFKTQLIEVLCGHVYACNLNIKDRRGDFISGYGKGTCQIESEVGSIFEAIEHYHAVNYASLGGLFSTSVSTYLANLRDNSQDIELEYIYSLIEEQENTQLVACRLHEVEGRKTLDVPYGLINPMYIHDLEDGTTITNKNLEDNFCYGKLRKYSSSNGMGAGSTINEALIHAISECIERQCVGDFLVRALGQKNKSVIKVIDVDTLPENIKYILNIIKKRHGDVYLFDIKNDIGFPVYLAYLDNPDPSLRCITMGGSIYPSYAASRALTEMLQALELIEYDESVGGRGLEERISRMFEMFNKDFYFFKRFSFQNLHEIVTEKRYIAQRFNNEEIEILSLKSHRKYLCDKLKSSGRNAWYTIYSKPTPSHSIAVVQVLISPFDGGFLLMHGIPVSISNRLLLQVEEDKKTSNYTAVEVET